MESEAALEIRDLHGDADREEGGVDARLLEHGGDQRGDDECVVDQQEPDVGKTAYSDPPF
jgi:hypothetical protein